MVQQALRARWAAAMLAAGCLVAGVRAQEPVSDPDLPAQLKELRAMVKEPHMADDFRAVELLRKLAADPGRRPPRDLDRIAEAIGDVFLTGKVRPPDRSQLYEQAATTLGTLGARGAKALRAAIADERLKDRQYARLRAHLLRAMGATEDPSQVEFLLDQALRSPDDEVMAAGGEALAHFRQLELTTLRDVVKRLISRFGEIEMKASQLDPPDPSKAIDFGPQNARATLQAIGGPWQATLRALTGQSFDTAADWQRWYNKNKDWQPPQRRG